MSRENLSYDNDTETRYEHAAQRGVPADGTFKTANEDNEKDPPPPPPGS